MTAMEAVAKELRILHERIDAQNDEIRLHKLHMESVMDTIKNTVSKVTKNVEEVAGKVAKGAHTAAGKVTQVVKDAMHKPPQKVFVDMVEEVLNTVGVNEIAKSLNSWTFFVPTTTGEKREGIEVKFANDAGTMRIVAGGVAILVHNREEVLHFLRDTAKMKFPEGVAANATSTVASAHSMQEIADYSQRIVARLSVK